MKLIGALALEHTKNKEEFGYLEYSLLMLKIHITSSHNFHTSVFKGQSDQGVKQLVIKPFGISQSSRIVNLS